jgi:hypothetical protein
MNYLLTFNESYLSNLTGMVLLSTLLSVSNVSKGQYNTHKIEQKAELSRLDMDGVLDVLDSLHSKGYTEYHKTVLSGDNFLFTSYSNVDFSQALLFANKDAELKMRHLGKIGEQLILRYTELNTWTVVIITEILDEDEPVNYNRATDNRESKW